MNLGIDVIGIQSVASIIRQSGLPRFFIIKGDKHLQSTPIFEVWDSSSTEVAQKKFIEWGNTILSGNPKNDQKYEIILHDQTLIVDDEDLAENGKPKRARKNRVSYSFTLIAPLNSMGNPLENQQQNFYPQQQQINAPVIDQSKYIPIAEFEARVAEKVRLEKMQMQIDSLQKELKNYDNEPKEEEAPKWMGMAEKVIDRLYPAMPPPIKISATQGAAIAGLDSLNDEQLDRIDDAVEILMQTDPKIIEHLEKLARLSKQQPQQFAFVIGSLDNMQI
jgi:hypothetical protein